MQVQPDDDLYSFEPIRVTKGDGHKEAFIFARYRAWAYFVGLTLLALATCFTFGVGPIGYIVSITWAGVAALALLRVLDHNRTLPDVLNAALADLLAWHTRPRRERTLTLRSPR